MSNPRNALSSLPHLRGIAGPVRAHASKGTGTPKASRGTSTPSVPRHLTLTALATLCALAGALAHTATPALAVKEYVPGAPATFGEPGEGAGQLKGPEGVAVNNETGDVYVADGGNHRVDVFNAKGEFQFMFGKDVNKTKVEGGISSEEEENVCAEEEVAMNGVECQEGKSGAGPGEFTTPSSIAIDNSTVVGDTSKGDVYVGDSGDGKVAKFTEAGVLVKSWGVEGRLGEVEAGMPFGTLHGVTVDASGSLWVLQGLSGAKNVDVFSALGVLEKTYQIEHGLGAGIAVDSRGDFYLHGITGIMRKYDAAGTEVAVFHGEVAENDIVLPKGHVSALAVDPVTGNLLVDQVEVEPETEVEHPNVAVYPPFAEPGAPVETFPGVSEPLVESRGIAVEGAGTAYVSQRGAGNVLVFNDVPLPEATPVQPGDITEASSTEDTVTLHGGLEPESANVTECKFEYGTTSASENSEPCDQGTPFSGPGPVVLSKTLKLAQRTTYHFRVTVVIDGASVSSQELAFFTVTKPVINGERSSEVGSGEATVSAQIDPAGLPTKYLVEYATSAQAGCFASKTCPATPEVNVGAGQSTANEQAHLTGLQAGSEYHYRFVATNALGTLTDVEEQTFTTPAATNASSSTLPDGRVDELVSTANATSVYEHNGGAGSPVSSEWAVRAAADGDAVAYVAEPPPEGGSGAQHNPLGDEFVARRTSRGWVGEVAIPDGAGLEAGYVDWSSDLSVGIIESLYASEVPGAPPCFNGSGGSNAYSYAERTGEGVFKPFFTQLPEPAAFPACETYGGVYAESKFAGANAGTGTVPQFSHLLYEVQPALTPGGEPTPVVEAATERGKTFNLYDAVGGTLLAVNVLPPGVNDAKPDPRATFGGPSLVGFSNVISADGSRIFWTDLEPGADFEHIFVRENDTSTVPVSAGAAEYLTATPDGRYAYYSEGEGLAATLWRFDTETGESTQLVASAEGRGNLTEGSSEVASFATTSGKFVVGERITGPGVPSVTPLTTSGGKLEHETEIGLEEGSERVEVEYVIGRLEVGETIEGEGIQPGTTVSSISGNGQEVELSKPVMGLRFHHKIVAVSAYTTVAGVGEHTLELSAAATESVAGAALESGAAVRGVLGVNESGEDGSYVYFVAESKVTEGENAEGSEPVTGRPNLYVSEHGVTKFVATVGDAAGNDWATAPGNSTSEVAQDGHSVGFFSSERLTALDNEGQPEIYVYDGGALWCASCGADGGAVPDTSNEKAGSNPVPYKVNNYLQRWFTDDGDRAFFEGGGGLLPQAPEGGLYEWERPGVGTCTEASGTYTPARGGCIYLIAGSGTSLLDASESGEDVFFASREDFTPQDPLARGEDFKLYDARVNGLRETSTACTGTGCQGVPPTPPIFATPSSATITGVDDVEPPPLVTPPKKTVEKATKCPKGERRNKHNQCVKVKTKHKKAKKASRPSNDRRAK